MPAIRRKRSWNTLLGLLLVLVATAAGAQPVQLLSFEAIPVAQVALPRAKDAPYAQKEEVARAVADQLVPAILRAAGTDSGIARTQVFPGGYMLQTDPALQTRVAATEAQAGRLAAALGYVLRQGSVLVSDLAANDGDQLQVTLRFPARSLTSERAQAFFAKAAGVDKGLGGGYSALGDAMVFINLRGADGKPMSALDDDRFLALMKQACEGFQDCTVDGSGKVRSKLVANDWKTAPNGEAYAKAVSDVLGELNRLRQRHTAMIDDAAAKNGWK